MASRGHPDDAVRGDVPGVGRASCWIQPGADSVRKVSPTAPGRALGVTLSTSEQDRYGYDVDYLRGRMIGALGGRAAEALVFAVTPPGAETDLEHATGIARQMVGRWGMSDQIEEGSVLPPEGSRSRLDNLAEQLLLHSALGEADAFAAAGVERVPQS